MDGFDPRAHSQAPEPSRAANRPRRGRTDEATTRNPVKSRLSAATPPEWAEAVTEQVKAARDRFHDLVKHGLSRTYRRPPIYLVDNWLVDVLGAFVSGVPAMAGEERPDLRGEREPGDDEEDDPWLTALMALFASLQPVTTALSQAWLLELRPVAERLEEAAVALAVATVAGGDVDAALANLRDALEPAADVPTLATEALAEHPVVARRLRPHVARTLAVQVARATDFAEHLATLRPRRVISQVGIQPGHPGGLLWQGLEALGIEAPAVIVAPRRIEAWSESLAEEVPALRDCARRGPAEDAMAPERRLWRQPAELTVPFRLALTSVVAHELTHVLVRLPSDRQLRRRQAAAKATRARDTLYRTLPGVEEGAANFLGGLAALQEAGELLDPPAGWSGEGPSAQARGSVDWAQLWRAHSDLVRATIGGYHREASLAWLAGWKGTRCELQAFAGVLAVLALRPEATDWQRTMVELERGRVSLAR